MQRLSHILLLIIAISGLSACAGGGAEPDLTSVQDIVIVGGDTLGRNWDNLPTEEEAEKAKAMGITPEQYKQLMEQEQMRLWQENQSTNGYVDVDETKTDEFYYEEYYKFEPTEFSKKMHKEETYTVLTTDGREVVVGSQDKGPGE